MPNHGLISGLGLKWFLTVKYEDVYKLYSIGVLIDKYTQLISFYFVLDCSLTLPTTPTGIECSIASDCLGFRCCLNMDLTVTQKTVMVYITLDICDFQISVGFGEWFLDLSLFTYDWGREEMHSLGDAIELR